MSGREVRIRAPAKVNLVLRIVAREDSGYHQLETVFLRIGLADDLVVRAGVAGRSVDCRGAGVGPMERNLAYRAAMALRDAGGPDTFAIEIDKQIPVGAGLGGGSADAAAVLRSLNQLSARPLPAEGLLALAASLGADVPFLTTGAGMAMAWGRGERMLSLTPPPARPMVVLVPPFPIATADAYGWIDAAGLAGTAPRMWQAEDLADWDRIARVAHNDFEAVVSARHPEIGLLVGALRESGAVVAQMSGSGSAVFGVFERDLPPVSIFERHGARVIVTNSAIPGT